MLVTRQIHTEHEMLKWLALLALAATLTVIFARQIHGAAGPLTRHMLPLDACWSTPVDR